MAQTDDPSPIDSIPTPDEIRDRLSRLFAEARLLRGLLRVSESKARQTAAEGPAEGQEVSHAG